MVYFDETRALSPRRSPRNRLDDGDLSDTTEVSPRCPKTERSFQFTPSPEPLKKPRSHKDFLKVEDALNRPNSPPWTNTYHVRMVRASSPRCAPRTPPVRIPDKENEAPQPRVFFTPPPVGQRDGTPGRSPCLTPPRSLARRPEILGDANKLRHGKGVRVEVDGQWKDAQVLASTTLFVTLKFTEDNSIATVPLARAPSPEARAVAQTVTNWVQLALSPRAAHAADDAADCEPAAPAPAPEPAPPQDWDRARFDDNIRWVQEVLTRVFDEKKFNANIEYVQNLLRAYSQNCVKPDTPHTRELYGDRHQFAFTARSTSSSPRAVVNGTEV